MGTRGIQNSILERLELHALHCQPPCDSGTNTHLTEESLLDSRSLSQVLLFTVTSTSLAKEGACDRRFGWGESSVNLFVLYVFPKGDVVFNPLTGVTWMFFVSKSRRIFFFGLTVDPIKAPGVRLSLVLDLSQSKYFSTSLPRRQDFRSGKVWSVEFCAEFQSNFVHQRHF